MSVVQIGADNWRSTHSLVCATVCSAVLISSSDLLKVTHNLKACSVIPISKWIWSTQTLERDSLAGGLFSLSCQWIWSAETQRLGGTHKLVGDQPFMSVDLICWTVTLERDSLPGGVVSHSCQWIWSAEILTAWRGGQPFCQCIWSAETLERDSLAGHSWPFLSVNLISWNAEEGLTSWRGGILVSGSDHWQLNTGDRLTCWRDSHSCQCWSAETLERDSQPWWSDIPVSGSDQLKHRDRLTCWRGSQPFLSVDLPVICGNTGDGLTCWRGGQPFLSVDLICRNRLTCWRGGQPFLSSNLLKHWKGTHSLKGLSAIL